MLHESGKQELDNDGSTRESVPIPLRPTLRVSGLSFAYGDFKVFENLSIEVDGRGAVLRGPSGCGKTTLLKLVSGFLNPADGTIESKITKPVFVSQEDALLPWLSGMKNIEKIANVSADQIRDNRLYSRMESFIHKRAYQMSFGQRRIVELARALLFKPDLLCLDEPLNFIDPSARELIQDILLGDTPELQDVLLLVASHDRADFSSRGLIEMSFNGSFPVRELQIKRDL